MERIENILAELRQIQLNLYRGKIKNLHLGDHASRIVGSGYEIKDIVPWERGDSFSDIDWQNTLLTWPKVYKIDRIEEKEAPVILVTDTSPSMLVRFADEKSKFTLMLRLLGLLGFTATHFHDPIGIYSFGSVASFSFQPRHGKGHILYAMNELHRQATKFYEQLERNLPWTGAGVSLTDALTTVLTRIRKRSTIFVVSDFMDVLTNPEALNMETFKALAGRHLQNVVTIFLEDEHEFNWPTTRGTMVVRNIETGQLEEMKASRAQAKRQEWQARRDALQKQLADIGVSSLTLSQQDYFKNLVDFLASRQN